MGKKLMLAIALLMASFQVNAQTQSACICTGPTVTKTYTSSWGGAYTITLVICPPQARVVNVVYTGPPAPFLLQGAMDLLLADATLSFTDLLFDGECAGMVPFTTTSWGEGSGPRGTTDFNLIYCTNSTTCCPLSRSDAAGAFVGIAPSCGNITIVNPPPTVNYNVDCYTICHPN